MKLKNKFILFIFVILVFTNPVNAQVTNGDFENGWTGWTTGGHSPAITINPAYVYNGGASAMLMAHGGSGAPSYAIQNVDVTGYKTLSFYAYDWTDDQIPYSTLYIQIGNIRQYVTTPYWYGYYEIDISSLSGVQELKMYAESATGHGTYLMVDDINFIGPPKCITWTTYPPDSWKVGNYSALIIGVPGEYKEFTFEYKTPSTNYTEMAIQKHLIPKTFNVTESKWYYWYSKVVYHSTYGNYSCRITHSEMGTETKTVSVPYFDPDVTLPPVVIIPIPDVWVDPPQWNVTMPDKYQNVSWLTDYTVFWDGVGNSTNYTLYATVGLLLTPIEMLNSSISTVHEYATTAGGMIAGFEHTAVIIEVGWDIIPDDIQNIFIGTAALGVVIFIYHRRT